MRLLFAHQNFPGQFKHLAPALAARGDAVVALTMSERPILPGVRTVRARATKSSSATHPWARHVETVAIRAEAGFRAAVQLKEDGFDPDVIVAHPAWGEGLMLKEVWPDARLGLYCEHFMPGREGGRAFDPEFGVIDDPRAIRASDKIKLTPQYLMMAMANAGLSPMEFQKSTFPGSFRDRIDVIHDGIDVDVVRRRTGRALNLSGGTVLTEQDEIVLFMARQLEPARGFNVFIRALPDLLTARPHAHFIVIGADGVAYGAPPPNGQGTWREIFVRELGDRVDFGRVHFVGQVAYSTLIDVLSIARLRIYLTHPTVLSWSVLEAMATGCAILGSNVAPVREIVSDGVTGMLFDYHDRAEMVAKTCELLDNHTARAVITENARRLIIERYALKTVCLPKQFAWIDRLAAADPLPPVMDV